MGMVKKGFRKYGCAKWIITQSENSGVKKGEKAKADSNPLTSKWAEVPDSITCHWCKQVFIDEDFKIMSCDRCALWFCIKCVHISQARYNFLASKEAEDIAWYCKPCKQPAKTAVTEDKNYQRQMQGTHIESEPENEDTSKPTKEGRNHGPGNNCR